MNGFERVLAVGALGVAAFAACLADRSLRDLDLPRVTAAVALRVRLIAAPGGHRGQQLRVLRGVPVAGDEWEVAYCLSACGSNAPGGVYRTHRPGRSEEALSSVRLMTSAPLWRMIAPTSTSDLDSSLKGRIWRALNIGRGRLTNLTRLDVRLALIALNGNRQDRYEETLVEHLAAEHRTPRSKRRQLDGEFYDKNWLLAG